MTSSVMAERRRLRKTLRNAILVIMAISSGENWCHAEPWRGIPCGRRFLAALGMTHAAVAQPHAAVRARHDGGVVGGEDEGGAGLGVELGEQVEDVRGRVGVGGGGRRCGEDELRLVGHGPGGG